MVAIIAPSLVTLFASAAALAGLAGGTGVTNLLSGFGMLIGRFAVLIPAVAIGGSLGSKRPAPSSAGTFSTDSPTFVLLLVMAILIVGALTFLPALVLGPTAGNLLSLAKVVF
jgi:K+-transporting ATPase ATPase A chain